MQGFLRSDGRKGIRNVLVVAYLVECAHHVAREITAPFRDDDVNLIGFPGCFPNDYAQRMMEQICTHPNVGGVLLVSLGCESFDRDRLRKAIADSGRPVKVLVIQASGGTSSTIKLGQAWVNNAKRALMETSRVDLDVSDLVIATICGGSDATSGLTANPAVGCAFDRLVENGAAAIFEETGELIGCEHHMAKRAVTPELGHEIIASVAKAKYYYRVMGHGSFAVGNASGGLTTIEEKSLGAYCKSGASQISGLLKPGDIPPHGGLYLLDIIPDGEPRFGFPNISDNSEIVELIACGAHITLFTTGRGSVVGSAISPVIKICANSETYQRMEDDMDIDAGRILDGLTTLDEVGHEIYGLLLEVAAGKRTASELLGHQEFILTYKTFEPDCLSG